MTCRYCGSPVEPETMVVAGDRFVIHNEKNRCARASCAAAAEMEARMRSSIGIGVRFLAQYDVEADHAVSQVDAVAVSGVRRAGGGALADAPDDLP